MDFLREKTAPSCSRDIFWLQMLFHKFESNLEDREANLEIDEDLNKQEALYLAPEYGQKESKERLEES